MNDEHMQMLRSEKHEELIRSIEKILLKDPDDMDAMADLAVAYQHAGLHNESLKVYNRLLAKQPDNPVTLVNVGQLLHVMRKPYEAKEKLTRVIEIAEKDTVPANILSMAHTNLGAVHRVLHQYEEAVFHYETAISLDPENLLAPKYLKTLIQLGRRGILCKKTLPSGQ